MKLDRILLIIALLLLVLGGAWVFLSRPATTPSAGKASDSQPEEVVLSATAVVPAASQSPTPTALEASKSPETQGAEAVSAIITAPDLGDNMIVEKLIDLLPKLDEAAQTEAAEHIANLSSDEEAVKWSQNVVAWNLPAPAAEVLYQSLNNRPHEVNYPVLGAIADNPQHPKNKETLETLSVISDPPPAGTTWTQWLQGKLREEGAPANP